MQLNKFISLPLSNDAPRSWRSVVACRGVLHNHKWYNFDRKGTDMQPNQNPNVQPQPVNPNQQPTPSPEQPGRLLPEVQPMPPAPELAPVAPPAAAPPPAQLPSIPPVPPVVPPVAPLAPGDPAAQPPQPAAPSLTPNPAEAADIDVIEKAWVDQADKIVKQTKQDPYVEEEAVEALQQDYLKKRYGHDVKKSDGQ